MNRRILVVDDEQDILETLSSILTDQGYGVTCAEGGEEAIRCFQKESFDVVITDMRMPGMDGLQVLKKIKAIEEDQEILILTGYASMEDAVQTLRENGAFDYLTKPLDDTGTLLAAVRRAIDRRKLRIQNQNLIRELKEKQSELEETNRILSKEILERRQAEEQLRISLKEKELLLKEIHHRVKNNLQVISSLLHMQSSQIKDTTVPDAFKESQNRIRSMALIHECLYGSKDLSSIDFRRYIQGISKHLFHTYGVDTNQIRLEIDVRDTYLDLDSAIPCGLIINELMSNCLKHAFGQSRGGTIRITFHPVQENQLHLSVFDDGVGFPRELDFRETETLGMRLVTRLVKQMSGTIELDRRVGTCFEIIFSG